LDQVAREQYLADQEAKKLVVAGELRACVEFDPDLWQEGICYIYLLTNLHNGKRYVGVSDDPNRRIAEHTRYKGTNVLITNALKKYGVHAFDKEILFKDTVEECFIKEDEYINLYESNMKKGGHGYNQREGGMGNRSGCTFEQWVRDKISAGKMGKSNGPHSEATKEKIRLGNIGKNAGKVLTKEHRMKIGATQKGKAKSAEHGKKLAAHLENVRPK
jgi:group I intron endonuclease